ncbi:MAG: DUF6430 domain-containing protein [Eubacteriales bacterium]|nr:DUF6430 domain-containing protein [Eubacteriales bacterium]
MNCLKKIYCHFTKVSFKDKDLWRSYGTWVAWISTTLSFVTLFVEMPTESKITYLYAGLFALALVLLFVCLWWRANAQNYVNLKINGTNIHVRIGDIWKQDGLKIIGVNNFIDLVADDVVVKKGTLHGQFIQKNQNRISEIGDAICSSRATIPEGNTTRPNDQSYDFGSCVLFEDCILTVLTKFDEYDRAYTSMEEYLKFWMTFWDKVDILYNCRTLNIPILGAGQTRFYGQKPTKQELLEIAIWTLWKSGFRNTYADMSINFIVYEGDASEIDFYALEKRFAK